MSRVAGATDAVVVPVVVLAAAAACDKRAGAGVTVATVALSLCIYIYTYIHVYISLPLLVIRTGGMVEAAILSYSYVRSKSCRDCFCGQGSLLRSNETE